MFPETFISMILVSYWLHFPSDQTTNNEACTNENRFVAHPNKLKNPLMINNYTQSDI